ncbi:hypothetical protein, partial [Sphingomonas sp. PAMC 26617]|uniref:hypothetical protein n=1 Tax=Sphingomonas sp. PAMC 26617 TaxID=1112216 RepID=UPI000288364D
PTLLTMQDVATPLNLRVVDLLEGSDALELPRHLHAPELHKTVSLHGLRLARPMPFAWQTKPVM